MAFNDKSGGPWGSGSGSKNGGSGNNNNPIQGNILNMPKWTPAALNAKPTVIFDSNLLVANPWH